MTEGGCQRFAEQISGKHFKITLHIRPSVLSKLRRRYFVPREDVVDPGVNAAYGRFSAASTHGSNATADGPVDIPDDFCERIDETLATSTPITTRAPTVTLATLPNVYLENGRFSDAGRAGSGETGCLTTCSARQRILSARWAHSRAGRKL